MKFDVTQYRWETPSDTDYNKIWALSSYATNRVDETVESHMPSDMSYPVENILSTMPSTTRSQLQKKDVMPTWAATRSLILRSEGKHMDIVHSEVVSPLLKSHFI